MVDNVASTYSQENAKEAFWRWLTKGGTQDPGTTAPSISGGGASKGTPALTLSTTNAAGSASTFVATDATIAEFDATAPTTSAVADAAAAGSAAKAARRDHVHGREAFATNTVALSTAAAAGAATTLIRSDATIAAFDATAPTTQAYGDAAAVGTAAFAARRDHKHGIPAAVRATGLVVKTATQAVNNSTVLVNCTDLSFAIAANATIAYRFVLRTDGATAGDIKLAITGPVGGTGFYSVFGDQTGASTFDAVSMQNQATTTYGTGITVGTIGAGNFSTVWVDGILVNSTNAGTIQLQFAQGTASGTDTNIFISSFGTYWTV